jgi:hypothetical protein
MRNLALALILVLSACSDDATTVDAAVPDAAVPDAALPDAAVPDAALPDAAVPDAALPDAALPDAGYTPWGSCFDTRTQPATACADWCAGIAATCGGTCGPAIDGNTYSSYFYDTSSACAAGDIIAAVGCDTSFSMEAASNHVFARCCCH